MRFGHAPMTAEPSDTSLVGSSSEVQFAALWQQFTRISNTTDTLTQWRSVLRRWITPILVSFIAPVTDPDVRAYLTAAQKILAPLMTYSPQPVEKLHITI